MEYHDFIRSKETSVQQSGFDSDKSTYNKNLFEWQKDIVHWVLKKGKACLFEDCGLGRSARDNEDEKHICPLQLTVIRRALNLWTNPNDIVLTPFMGIGSEVVTALENNRRAVGIELKDSYYRQAEKNARAVTVNEQLSLW